MIVTPYLNFTDSEVLRLADDSNDPLVQELARRLTEALEQPDTAECSSCPECGADIN